MFSILFSIYRQSSVDTLPYHYTNSTAQTLDICLRMGSKDNMTTLLVKFPAQTIGQGEGIAGRRKLRGALESEGNDPTESNDDGIYS